MSVMPADRLLGGKRCLPQFGSGGDVSESPPLVVVIPRKLAASYRAGEGLCGFSVIQLSRSVSYGQVQGTRQELCVGRLLEGGSLERVHACVWRGGRA